MAVQKRLRSHDSFFADGDYVSLGNSQTIAIFCMEDHQDKADDIVVDNWNQFEEDHGQEYNNNETL